MVRRIIWSKRAVLERQEILLYWVERNKSKSYSIKLNKLISEEIKILAKNPFIGRETDDADIRIKVVRDYLLFYEVRDNELHILSLWDSRRNPGSFQLK
ncbi:MAG: addiction module toxin RelE [Cytophagaceae bacterium SCN 52-12]|nr:MAG: addiction module toxin RelE [Cytophagaceae bacterium SCN 52-12]